MRLIFICLCLLICIPNVAAQLEKPNIDSTVTFVEKSNTIFKLPLNQRKSTRDLKISSKFLFVTDFVITELDDYYPRWGSLYGVQLSYSYSSKSKKSQKEVSLSYGSHSAVHQLANMKNRFVSLGYEIYGHTLDYDYNRFTFTVGGGLYFHLVNTHRENDPLMENDRKRTKYGMSVGAIPRIQYHINRKLYLDVNISMLQLSFLRTDTYSFHRSTEVRVLSNAGYSAGLEFIGPIQIGIGYRFYR